MAFIPFMPQKFTSLEQIVRNGFCIGCGLCAWAAPSAEIQMRPNGHGHLRPIPARPPMPEEENKILALCPGIVVSGARRENPDAPRDPVWGTAMRVVRGHATDAGLRFRASSGGVMTAINRHLLRSGEVAFVLQVIPDPNQPFGSLAAVCRNQADLDAAGGSRYGSCAPLLSLPEALGLDEPFAVSLKPCDIAAVENLKRHDPRARNLIRFTQAMFCGSVPGFDGTKLFFERRGVNLDREQPVSFRWRGEGCPGATRAVMPRGTVLSGTYAEMWWIIPGPRSFAARFARIPSACKRIWRSAMTGRVAHRTARTTAGTRPSRTPTRVCASSTPAKRTATFASTTRASGISTRSSHIR